MSKVISGTAYWASVITPNTKFDADGVWTIDVGNLDDLNKKKAQKDGLTVKNKGDEKDDFVTIKRKVRNAKGNLNRQPNVVDANKTLITETMVGNGSKVKVLYKPFDWKFAGKSGTSLDLQAVQVIDLVPYGEDFDVSDGGYVAEGNNEEF